jgi:hypothetical protein
MARLYGHVLAQRSMCPTFPASTDACVDYSHAHLLNLTTLPDVLVLPSPIVAGAKMVQVPIFAEPSGECPTSVQLCCCDCMLKANRSAAVRTLQSCLRALYHTTQSQLQRIGMPCPMPSDMRLWCR